MEEDIHIRRTNKKEICSNCFATRITIRFLGRKREFERDLFRVDRQNTYRFFAILIIEINKCLNCFTALKTTINDIILYPLLLKTFKTLNRNNDQSTKMKRGYKVNIQK